MSRTVGLDDIIAFDGRETTIRKEFRGRNASKFGLLRRSFGDPETEWRYALLSRKEGWFEAIPISRRTYDELCGLGAQVA